MKSTLFAQVVPVPELNAPGWTMSVIVLVVVLFILFLIARGVVRSAITSAAGAWEGTGYVMFALVVALLLGVVAGGTPVCSHYVQRGYTLLGLTGKATEHLDIDPDASKYTWDATKKTLDIPATARPEIQQLVTYDFGGGRQEVKIFGNSVSGIQIVPNGVVSIYVMYQDPSARQSSKMISVPKKS